MTKSRGVRRARGTCGGKRCVQGFGGGNLNERDHLEDLNVDERIM